MGKGINISAFEADSTWQPPFDTSYFKIIAGLGFTHVRIPINWERGDRSMAAPPYTIYPAFLSTIKTVVDAALRNKLHIIINMHNHTALMADPAGQKARFLAQWSQISDYFKDYPDSLLFEVLNEPNGALTPALWNDFFAEALAKIRIANPKRCVLIGTALWGGVDGLDSLLIPNDDHLILTIHYYNPFHFTHQGAEWVEGSDQWMGTTWNDTQFEREDVSKDFGLVVIKSKTIPVHIGEYGSYNKGDIASRLRWTRFVSNWITQHGFSRAYWEFDQGFGFYDLATLQLNMPLVNAIFADTLPLPTPVQLDTIYAGNFTSGMDGWFLSADASASATAAVSNGVISISITRPGTQQWYIQLIKGGFSIQPGKTYHVSFIASSSISPRKIYADVAMSTSPWSVYSNYDGFYLTDQPDSFGFTFTANTTDPNCNIVFSVGDAGTGTVNISHIVFEEVL